MAFGRSETKKIALFVDGSNQHAANRALGWDADFSKILAYFKTKGELLRAYYYTAVPKDGPVPIRPMIDFLSYNGWNVVQKYTKNFTDSAGRIKVKGNMDIEICSDILCLVLNPRITIDEVIVFTGDGDFNYLVNIVKGQGVKFTVVSTIEVDPPMIADELRRSCDTFIELNDMKGRWERT